MSTCGSKPDGTAPGSSPLEELAPVEEPLTPDELEQIHGGVTIKGALPDVCKTPLPGGPMPIPYPN